MKTAVWVYSHLSHPMGGTKYIWEVASRLRNAFSNDIENVIVVAQHGTPKVVEEFTRRGVEVALLDEPSTDGLGFWGAAPLAIKRSARKLRGLAARWRDPVFLTSMYPGNWILKAANYPFTQIIYEPFAYFWDRKLLAAAGWKIRVSGEILRRAWGWSDVSATRAARRLLTLSPFTERQITDVYGRNDAKSVYEGVDIAFFKPTPLEPDRWPQKRVIFHSTDFSAIKRTDVVFDAFAELARSRDDLMLAVSTTRSNVAAQAEMHARLRNQGISTERAVFLGTIPYSDLPRYYSRADLVLHPVVNQPMSFVVKEALACGTPVVRGNDPDCDFEDGTCGFLADPERIDEVVRACAKILDDQELRARFAAAGRELIMNRYNWDSVTRRIGEVLLES